MLSHPSRKRRCLDGAQSIEGEPGVKNLAGPPAHYRFRLLQLSRLRAGSERSIMEAAGTRMNEPEMSFVDFCRMTEGVLVSIDKELVVKGVSIDEGLRKKMGELIIRSRKVTNPEG